MRSRFRILDANLNRAREGLRVLEDVARFALDDARAAASLKDLRHRLERITRPIHARLLEARDSAGDVGRGRDLPVRAGRSLDDVVSANSRRAQEALRAIEESARGDFPWVARAAHEVRYSCYGFERRLAPRARRRSLLEDVRLYVLVDPSVAPLARARDAVAGGAQMLQLRSKKGSAAALLKQTRWLKKLGVPVIVNDRVDIAIEADGVHLGEGDLPVREARKRLGEWKIVGATSHSPAEARRAVREGADYVSVGPMFETPLKPGLKARGFSYLKSATSLGVPAFCIGGITPDNVKSVARRGGRRIAVCSSVLAAKSPRAAARALARALKGRKR